MLPSFLFPSYKQYKADTDAVATWLAKTARQCGYANKTFEQSSSQQKAQKLKGRARKLARDAARNKTSDGQNDDRIPPECRKYLFAIKDFVSLAEWIAKSTDPRLKIPSSFVTVLNRAIIVRKRHYKWWYSQSEGHDSTTKEGEQANNSHGYFIDVLEKVKEVFQQRIPTQSLSDPPTQFAGKAPAPEGSVNAHLVNLFENLNVEEPSDAFLKSAADSSGGKPVNTPLEQYCVDQAPDIEEVYFALHWLFNDIHHIRQYLRQVWDGYRQREFDLVAVSITTNTAIDFVKRLEEDFVGTFPDHADFRNNFDVLYAILCLANGQAPSFRATRRRNKLYHL